MSTVNYVRSLAWAALIVALMTTMASASSNTGIFEVDLLFPKQNTTYTPNPLFPIVFAVQNPRLVKSLITSISWSLVEGNYPGDNAGNDSNGPGRSLPAHNTFEFGSAMSTPKLFSSSEPHLITYFVNTTSYPEGAFTLDWQLDVTDCFHHFSRWNTPIFFTSWSGQAPDLVAATSADTCRNTIAYAFNITQEGCPHVVVSGPTPTTNPCAVTIDPAAASSISAAATSRACARLGLDNYILHPYPNVTCPTSTPPWASPSSTSAGTAGRSRMAAGPTFLALLATLTTVIRLG